VDVITDFKKHFVLKVLTRLYGLLNAGCSGFLTEPETCVVELSCVNSCVQSHGFVFRPRLESRCEIQQLLGCYFLLTVSDTPAELINAVSTATLDLLSPGRHDHADSERIHRERMRYHKQNIYI
jgi:hypothetical protein